MRRFTSKFKLGLSRTRRPPVALQLAPRGILAAALTAPSQTAAYAMEPLPANALVPGVAECNLRARETVVTAIRSALEKVSPQAQAVTLILPDTTVRVFVLDFDALPDDPAGAAAILRFRLRKLVRFDVENARLSFQVLSRSEVGYKVLVAISPTPILDEYESAVRAAGYESGAVLSSALAALAAFHSDDPVLTACLDDESLTTAISSGNDLLLYRTHELSEEPDDRLAEVQRDIAVAAAYFEDNLKRRPQQVRYAGIATAEEFAQSIAAYDLVVSDIAPLLRADDHTSTARSDATSRAAVAGALAGAG
jgi:type IV pilus assembly protein PilM